MLLNRDYRRVMEGGRFVKLGKTARINKWHSLWIATTCFILLFLLLVVAVFAEDIDAERLADAIYLSEGGENTKYPYGIRSVNCEGETECRRVCINTIRNNKRRWENAKAKGDERSYLEFLAARYAPIASKNDPTGLNKNWLGNVKYFYKRGAK